VLFQIAHNVCRYFEAANATLSGAWWHYTFPFIQNCILFPGAAVGFALFTR
jgi:hypothetical protein